ncbi:hypothetical protein, conserved [Leishmania tarentolae]|uniref:Uncharacterized protein n=1 Tax=Leishmania tarentolae TaxID=5689 RepID=A0A640KL06_LEITA|nr:hypothetical protein, conserved [Leishmania tarentolae]
MCSEVLQMPLAYWLLCAVCIYFLTSIIPFLGVCKHFFQVKYGCTGDAGAPCLSFHQITSAVANLVTGLAVDSVGCNTFWLILDFLVFVVLHELVLATRIHGAVLMVLMRCFCTSLVSGLWSSSQWAVPGTVLGVAYGAMTSI